MKYRFDNILVEPDRRRVLIEGVPAKIGARAYDILLALIERRERVVSKNELFDLVWPNAIVEEGNLQVHIFALRKLIGAHAIATVPGRGYQFVGAIEHQTDSEPSFLPRARPVGASWAQLTNLQPNATPLYGRDVDTSSLRALITQHRLVSIVGPGGVGKTRLAQLVAYERCGVDRDGVWLAELAPIESADLVVSTVARALSHTVGFGESAAASLVDTIRDQQLLLVLDNCEHLSSIVAELCRTILTGARGVRVLVTSQEPLHLIGEQVYRLGPLSVPPDVDLATATEYGSVALFVARAQAANARFELNEDNVGAAVEICSQLDGIALAIEFAAARVPLLGVHGVRQRLGERLRLFEIGAHGVLPRHRALSAALAWSYSLLSDDERHVIDRLGIFVGGFSLDAALELVSDDIVSRWAALEHLSMLVDKSLIMVDPGDPPRYRLLETTRTFALERLTSKKMLQETRRKHAMALIATLQACSFDKSPLARTGNIAPDIDNLRAAARWAIGPGGDRSIAVELVGEANFIWYVLGLGEEGAELFRTVEPWIDESIPPAVAATFWLSRSKLYSAATQTAADVGLRAVTIFRSLGNRELLFDALTNVALQSTYAGNFAEAEVALSEAKSLIDPKWPRWTRVVLEFASSSVQYWAGMPLEASRGFRKALRLSMGNGGDASYTEVLEMLLLGCDVALHNSYDVIRVSREMLERTNPPVRGVVRTLTESFRIAALVQIGELDEAEIALVSALPRIRRALGTVRTTLCHIASLRAQQGRYADAAALLGAVDALRPVGVPILAPPNRASYEDAVAIITKTLDGAEFDRQRARGRTLTENEAIAMAFQRE
jgi:predicted ATPase/DNA-binding winged helix-turn-helix (wHTH) protein